ncbi:MAG: phosphatidylinositol mannoside acyltransferase [Bifidobacteriaceae bacterium]|nr:phosphatidylinositol mannoside acyltransferase [Bifidobacteriaceae bacterium]
MNLTQLAWRVVPRLPRPVARALFTLAADVAVATGAKGPRQLRANLARVVPDAPPALLRRLTRRGMRRYLRYFCEAFQLSSWSEAEVDAMVTAEGEAEIKAAMGEDRQVVAALGHMGNWDLAGAWAARHLAPVVTVAERLKPEAVFQEFLAMRQQIGLTVIPLDPGGGTFRQLRQTLEGGKPWIAPLLADRDLGRSGVEVDFFGQRALVAPGPAALALATGRPLTPVSMSRRGRGYVLRFLPPVRLPEDVAPDRRVEALTQAWVTALEAEIRRHPADWHMLQKVFVADLDLDRLARSRGAGEA